MIQIQDKMLARIAELYRLIDNEKDGRKTISLREELDDLNKQVRENVQNTLSRCKTIQHNYSVEAQDIISPQKNLRQQAKEATELSRKARELVKQLVTIKRQIRDAAEANRKKRGQ